MDERVRKSFKEGGNGGEGRDVRGGGSRTKGGEVDISMVRDD